MPSAFQQRWLSRFWSMFRTCYAEISCLANESSDCGPKSLNSSGICPWAGSCAIWASATTRGAPSSPQCLAVSDGMKWFAAAIPTCLGDIASESTVFRLRCVSVQACAGQKKHARRHIEHIERMKSGASIATNIFFDPVPISLPSSSVRQFLVMGLFKIGGLDSLVNANRVVHGAAVAIVWCEHWAAAVDSLVDFSRVVWDCG